MKRIQYLRHGTERLPGGGVRFRLWAPAHSEIGLLLGSAEHPLAMKSASEGWHELEVPDAGVGTRYLFQLPDGTNVPDPASRYQPEDIHGPSEVIDPSAYPWTDVTWAGQPWHEAVVYELHVGVFTAAGTFAAAIERLDHLAGLGVTAIEIMPVSDFPGNRNWGYDGVLPTPRTYHTAARKDFKAFVEAAHARGLMGPRSTWCITTSGRTGTSCPPMHQGSSPSGIRRRGEPRSTMMANTAGQCGSSSSRTRSTGSGSSTWTGCGSNAVHAIMDDSSEHLLDELALRVREAADHPVYLILENEENQASRLLRDGRRMPVTYTAQWNDMYITFCTSRRRTRTMGITSNTSATRRSSAGPWPKASRSRAR